MAYDYDVDILAALWTGAEDGEEPYASILAANPTLTDEVSELRILSSIELLRSHMELLASRDEANILHFAISRLIRHTAGGSNPYSDEAKITTAVGNVNNPTFPAGATLDITIGGSTVSPASATGGDCATVAAELNAVLDALGGGESEFTEVDAIADVDGSLGGKYFTLNSAGDVTNYYVWIDHPGRNEWWTITPVADVEGSLGGTSFNIWSADDATAYYVWFNHPARAETFTIDFTGITGASLPTGVTPAAYFDVTPVGAAAVYRFWFWDGSTTAPAVTTESLIPIAFTGAETDQDISDLVVTALVVGTGDADLAGADNAGGTTPLITCTHATAGAVADPVDGAVATGAVFAVTTQGLDAPADPAPGGKTAIEVAYSLDDSATEVGGATSVTLGAHGDFSTESSNPFNLFTVSPAPTTDAVDVDSGFGIVTTQQGVYPAVDPAPGGLTGIPASIIVGDDASEVGSALRIAIDANPDFSAEGAGVNVDITNSAFGVTTDAADVDTGFSIATVTQGADASADLVPVTAVCVQPGPRLAIQAQEDFVTFSLSNGGGGIIGPAGIIPGERESTPKKVANKGRDTATGLIVGKLKNQGGL